MNGKREGYWQRGRRGLPQMTSYMMPVLQFLRDAKREGWTFVALDKVHGKTLNTLLERDWVFESVGIDGSVKHSITERGLQALKVYEPKLRRDDGMCPECEGQPVHRYKSGRKAGYCKDCLSKRAKDNYVRRVGQARPDRLCSRCRKFPRYVRPSGRCIPYCLHCKNVLGRRQKRRMHKRNIKRIQNGELLPCLREGCNEQRYHSQNTVYDWCHKHYREYMNDYYKRKNEGKPPKPLGRPKKQQLSIQD